MPEVPSEPPHISVVIGIPPRSVRIRSSSEADTVPTMQLKQMALTTPDAPPRA